MWKISYPVRWRGVHVARGDVHTRNIIRLRFSVREPALIFDNKVKPKCTFPFSSHHSGPSPFFSDFCFFQCSLGLLFFPLQSKILLQQGEWQDRKELTLRKVLVRRLKWQRKGSRLSLPSLQCSYSTASPSRSQGPFIHLWLFKEGLPSLK